MVLIHSQAWEPCTKDRTGAHDVRLALSRADQYWMWEGAVELNQWWSRDLGSFYAIILFMANATQRWWFLRTWPEKRKRYGEVQHWLWAAQHHTIPLQAWFTLRPAHLVTHGIPGSRGSRSFTTAGFNPRGSRLRLFTPWGLHHNKSIQWKFPEYSPPKSSIFLKICLVNIPKALQEETKHITNLNVLSPTSYRDEKDSDHMKCSLLPLTGSQREALIHRCLTGKERKQEDIEMEKFKSLLNPLQVLQIRNNLPCLWGLQNICISGLFGLCLCFL